MSPTKIGLAVAAVAALGAGAVAGASLASAAGNDSTTSAYGEGHRGPGEGGRGPGGPGGPQDTPLTGAELAKVTSAVKAKDSSVSVQSVRQDPDGSYDVLGTKDGAPVMLEVSKDLKTVTVGPGGHPGGPGDRGRPPAQGGTSEQPSSYVSS